MTVDEMLAREAIRHTIASYTMAGDRLKADEFAAQFTDDGILESEGLQGSDQFRHAGNAAIRAWLGDWNERAARMPNARRATVVRHHTSTSQIDLTSPMTAQGRTYWVAYTDIGPDHAGYYLDTFRKEGDRWLIAHRRVRMDWRAPTSLFAHGPA